MGICVKGFFCLKIKIDIWDRSVPTLLLLFIIFPPWTWKFAIEKSGKNVLCLFRDRMCQRMTNGVFILRVLVRKCEHVDALGTCANVQNSQSSHDTCVANAHGWVYETVGHGIRFIRSLTNPSITQQLPLSSIVSHVSYTHRHTMQCIILVATFVCAGIVAVPSISAVNIAVINGKCEAS